MVGGNTSVNVPVETKETEAIMLLSKFMSKPSVENWKGVKRVLRYVQGTLDYGLMYSAEDTSTTLAGYADADRDVAK